MSLEDNRLLKPVIPFYKIIMRTCYMLISFFLCLIGKGQSGVISVKEWLASVPPVVQLIDSAGRMFARGEVNPFVPLEKKMKEELLQLANKAGRKSYLLALLSDTYDGSTRYDINRQRDDRAFTLRQRECSLEIAAALDNYTRKCSDHGRILSSEEFISRAVLTRYLEAAGGSFLELKEAVSSALLRFDLYCRQKGFQQLIDEGNSVHPHYLQALEAHGFLLNHVKQLLEMSKAYGEMTAKWLQDCKSLPCGCH